MAKRLELGPCSAAQTIPCCNVHIVRKEFELALQEREFMELNVPTHNGVRELRTAPECVDCFYQTSTMDPAYIWPGCPACQRTDGRPQKMFVFSEAPDVLCVKLNRGDPYNQPLATQALHIGTQEYSLQSLVIYRGDTQRGHCWALGSDIVQGNDWWVCYNGSIRRDARDDDFQGAEEAEIFAASGQVYMLLYSRTGEQR